MNWKPLTDIKQLPIDRNFLLWDANETSRISVYEAMIYDTGILGCPAIHEEYNIKDFSHWCDIIGPDEDVADIHKGKSNKVSALEVFDSIFKTDLSEITVRFK